MKRRSFPLAAVCLAGTILAVIGASAARAETIGYVTGLSGVEAFSTATGALLNTVYPGGISGTVAVSADGTLLYTGAITGSGTFTTLDVLSASTGGIVSQIAGLYSTPKKTILDVTGTYAFVLCEQPAGGKNSVTIVNLVKQKIVGYIYVSEGSPVDIAMAPNGSKLFVSVQPISGNSGRIEQANANPSAQGLYTCKPVGNLPRVCIFNTEPFGLANTVSGVAGDIAVSQDGAWLYAWSLAETTYLTVLDTASLAVSEIKMAKGNYVFGFAVAPSGNQAVILAVGESSTSFLTLDTKTNALSGTFAGLGPQVPPFGSNVVAFSPDGTSLWSLDQCVDSDACFLLVGQSFPSGVMISQTVLGTFQEGSAITF